MFERENLLIVTFISKSVVDVKFDKIDLLFNIVFERDRSF